MEDGKIKKLLKPGDILVVDRGFRDVVEDLKKDGFQVLMPAMKGKRKQLPCSEANESRKVTKIRWVVEAVHGAVAQKYSLLHDSLDNKFLPKVRMICQIIRFLENKFGKRLDSDKSNSDKIVEFMKSRMSLNNSLHQEVEEGRWNLKSTVQPLDSSSVLEFPRLTEEEMKLFFTGTYQMSLAAAYLGEIIEEGSPKIFHVKENENIIRLSVRSRHINSKYYKAYVEYKAKNDITGIERYCCECPNGMRTVGCCAHVACVIYYLSYARYQSKILRPADFLTKIFSKEEVYPVIEENSEDDT